MIPDTSRAGKRTRRPDRVVTGGGGSGVFPMSSAPDRTRERIGGRTSGAGSRVGRGLFAGAGAAVRLVGTAWSPALSPAKM